MKAIIASAIATIWALAIAASVFAGELSIQDLKSRLQVEGIAYVMDPSGKRFLHDDTNTGRTVWFSPRKDGKVEGQFFPRGAAIRHFWEVQGDGQLKARIEQYENAIHDEKTGEITRWENLIRKQEFNVENLAPITWKYAVSGGSEQVVVRLSPGIRPEEAPRDLYQLPISGTDFIATDSHGRVWADKFEVSGTIIGLKTQFGSLYLSYYPFAGANPFGFASDNKITLSLRGNKTLLLTSMTPFLPKGVKAKVYGTFLEADKSALLGILSYPDEATLAATAKLKSDKMAFDRSNNIVMLSGHALVRHFEKDEVTGQEISFDKNRHIITCTGSCTFRKGNKTIGKGDRLRVNTARNEWILEE